MSCLTWSTKQNTSKFLCVLSLSNNIHNDFIRQSNSQPDDNLRFIPSLANKVRYNSNSDSDPITTRDSFAAASSFLSCPNNCFWQERIILWRYWFLQAHCSNQIWSSTCIYQSRHQHIIIYSPAAHNVLITTSRQPSSSPKEETITTNKDEPKTTLGKFESKNKFEAFWIPSMKFMLNASERTERENRSIVLLACESPMDNVSLFTHHLLGTRAN